MRTIAIEGFGGRDRLKLMDLPVHEPGPDNVLVRVRAAGVGLWDTKTREGLFGKRSFPHVLGVEASGIVESAGENVADLLCEGDEVYVSRAHLQWNGVVFFGDWHGVWYISWKASSPSVCRGQVDRLTVKR